MNEMGKGRAGNPCRISRRWSEFPNCRIRFPENPESFWVMVMVVATMMMALVSLASYAAHATNEDS